MELMIRYANTADAESIALLSRKTFYDTFAAVNSKEDMDKFMNETFSMDVLKKEVQEPSNIFITAFMGDELVGYAKMIESENPPQLRNVSSIEISRLYAAQHIIGKGIGKALMEKCISVGIEKNKSVIWLGVWEHNQRAISFYTKFGYQKFGEHPFILGNDVQTDWLMKKDL
ncbi:MAG: GNAT family N-acetyltransferase [Chitinophagaceae bacterium]